MQSVCPTALIGVDGGGSGCRVAVISMAGERLGYATGGPANYTSDPERAVRNVVAAVNRAVADASLSETQVTGAVTHIGLAGILAHSDTTPILNNLPIPRVTISDDRRSSVAGALGHRDGVLVSVGTGSFVAVQRELKVRYFGGWGLRIGDQASGAWLGRSLLERAVLVHDGLAPLTPLTDAVLDRFHQDAAQITEFAMSADPAAYAEFAPLITEAVQSEDGAALNLLHDGAAYLTTCLEKAALKEKDVLCLVGSLGPHYAPFLEARFRAAIADPLGTALDGALMLARDAATAQ